MDFEELQEKIFSRIPYERIIPLPPRVRWGIVAAVPLAVLALVYFLLVGATLDEAGKIKDELLKVQKDVEVKEAMERKLPEFLKKIGELDSQLALIRRQLPEKREIPDLLDQISSIGTQSGLEFITFKPQPEIEKDFYAEVPVDLVMVGTYHNAVEFFDKVSRLPRIIAISNLTIKKGIRAVRVPSAARGVPITASCKAITFRFLESRVDAAADLKVKK